MNYYPLRNVLRTELNISKSMKRTILVLLLSPLLPSCETAHHAAVSSFRVVDAPAAYVRRRLEVDEEPQTTSTTTTTETRTYSDTAAYPPAPPYPVPPPPPPVQTQRPIVTNENNRPAETEARPTATPRVARSDSGSRAQSTNPSTTRPASSQNSELPYGKPVPGKPGYVFSPYDKNGGYVDVTGYSPGQKVKDPYTGKIFLVP